MNDSADIIDKFQATIDPFVKPREHVNYIRRVLALHLQSSSSDSPIKQPVSLINRSQEVALTPEVKGIQRQLIEALKANVAARRKYDDVAKANTSKQTAAQGLPPSKFDLVEERIGLLKLQTKQARLSAVEKHFDVLVGKPAALQGFLDVEEIFH